MDTANVAAKSIKLTCGRCNRKVSAKRPLAEIRRRPYVCERDNCGILVLVTLCDKCYNDYRLYCTDECRVAAAIDAEETNPRLRGILILSNYGAIYPS